MHACEVATNEGSVEPAHCTVSPGPTIYAYTTSENVNVG